MKIECHLSMLLKWHREHEAFTTLCDRFGIIEQGKAEYNSVLYVYYKDRL